MKINIVPTTEKHDATRSVVSNDLNCACVKEAAMVFVILEGLATIL